MLYRNKDNINIIIINSKIERWICLWGSAKVLKKIGKKIRG